MWRIQTGPERFHSRLNAVSKTYRYQIEMGPKKDVFRRSYYYGLGQELDVDSMERAAAFLTGTWDFKSFSGNKKMKKSTVRTLESICFERLEHTRLHISFTGKRVFAADGAYPCRNTDRSGAGQAQAGGHEVCP